MKMFNNIIQYKPRRQGKSLLQLNTIKFATTHLKNEFLYYCSNNELSQNMLNRMLPHLITKIIDKSWIMIKPCDCIKNG